MNLEVNSNQKEKYTDFLRKFLYLYFLYKFKYSSECHAYLPPFETITIYHCADIVANKRKMIKCEEVKVL